MRPPGKRDKGHEALVPALAAAAGCLAKGSFWKGSPAGKRGGAGGHTHMVTHCTRQSQDARIEYLQPQSKGSFCEPHHLSDFYYCIKVIQYSNIPISTLIVSFEGIHVSHGEGPEGSPPLKGSVLKGSSVVKGSVWTSGGRLLNTDCFILNGSSWGRESQ